MGAIGFFQTLDFIRGEMNREGCDGVLQMVRLGSPNNWGGDNRLGEHPGQRDMQARNPFLFRNFRNPLNYLSIGFV